MMLIIDSFPVVCKLNMPPTHHKSLLNTKIN